MPVILVFLLILVIQVIVRSPNDPHHSSLFVHANRRVLVVAYIAQFMYNCIRMERSFDQLVSLGSFCYRNVWEKQTTTQFLGFYIIIKLDLRRFLPVGLSTSLWWKREMKDRGKEVYTFARCRSGLWVFG